MEQTGNNNTYDVYTANLANKIERLRAINAELMAALDYLYLNANMICQRLELEDRETPGGIEFPCRASIPAFADAVRNAKAAIARAAIAKAKSEVNRCRESA